MKFTDQIPGPVRARITSCFRKLRNDDKIDLFLSLLEEIRIAMENELDLPFVGPGGDMPTKAKLLDLQQTITTLIKESK